MQSMQNQRRWRASHVIIALLLMAAGAVWIAQTIRRGAMSFDPANATTIVRSRPADGNRNVALDQPIVATLGPGASVDLESLDVESVRLSRASDEQPVPGQILASGVGDEIIFTPVAPLDPLTRYVFEVRGAKDANAAEIIPYRVMFTTKAPD